ncbi:hypothetical protein A7A09_019335 [Paracoccus methylarcula]|uniref:Uncharacterized protein n=1 Tax=Paracoccus methylarcula TaxID=72022 RepID=A0A3R7LN06_9RHOB|nr:hypothetical protein A7A09_019335 [Paracoccus methylarcula]
MKATHNDKTFTLIGKYWSGTYPLEQLGLSVGRLPYVGRLASAWPTQDLIRKGKRAGMMPAPNIEMVRSVFQRQLLRLKNADHLLDFFRTNLALTFEIDGHNLVGATFARNHSENPRS